MVDAYLTHAGVGFEMKAWFIWTLVSAAAAVIIPLAAGEIALWGGFFRKDPDDVSHAADKSGSTNLSKKFEIAGPEPDLF
jgi:hypothetical protein